MKKVNDKNGKSKKYERLAEVKFKMKSLEKEAKDLQEELLGLSPPEKTETEFGILKLESRHNFKIRDNQELIQKSSLTKEIFINSAKIAVSTVEKIVGNAQFVRLIEEGVINEEEPSRFFKLVEKNRKGETS